VWVTPGPDIARLALGAAALDAALELLPQSDQVGLRFAGPSVDLTTSEEILSRGVPVGAVEVTPSGELLVLMRGRLVTAGYPVVAVVTSASLDDLAQARPGDTVRLTITDVESARRALHEAEEEHQRLAARVRRAFEARGLGSLLAPAHASRVSDGRE
jgi:allophanate hydrolase subunit 2